MCRSRKEFISKEVRSVKNVKYLCISILIVIISVCTFLRPAFMVSQPEDMELTFIRNGQKNEESFGTEIRLSKVAVNEQEVPWSDFQNIEGWTLEGNLLVSYTPNEQATAKIMLSNVSAIKVDYIKQSGSGYLLIQSNGEQIAELDLYSESSWEEGTWNYQPPKHFLPLTRPDILIELILFVYIFLKLIGYFYERYQLNTQTLSDTTLKCKNHNMANKIIVSFCLALFLTLATYPGILYTDSFERWRTAKALLEGVNGIMSWVSITPQFFMLIFYYFTQTVASFTFVQAFLFFFSTLLIMEHLKFHYYWTIFLIIAICPIFYGFSVYHEMSVGCIIGINFTFLLLFFNKLSTYKYWTFKNKLLYQFALTLSLYITFGFRQNAFTIIPALILAIFYLIKKKNKNKSLGLNQLLSICISLMLVFMVPSITKVEIKDSSSAGFLWEILSTIQTMPPDKQNEYLNYLDFLTEDEGSTLKALNSNRKDSVNGWLWTTYPPIIIGDKNNSSLIKEKYFNLLFNEPQYFIKNKLYFINRTLGINQPLSNVEYYYDTNNIMRDYGMKDTTLRKIVVDSYNDFLDTFTFFRLPYLWFIVCTLSVLFKVRISKKDEYVPVILLYLVAVLYYAGFLVNTQSFEFRYFFPSFYILVLIILSVITDLVYRISLNKG